jgi:hypothetical protein
MKRSHYVLSPKSISRIIIIAFVLITGPFANAQSVNPIIGDESYLETFGEMPNDKTPNVLRVQTHLKYVEEMLRKKDVSHLSPELQSRRTQLLDLLREYHQRGKFPDNHHPSGDRKPCFIDDSGTICAVGYLVEQTASRETAEALNKKFQYETIMDMNSPILEKWISESGFTKEEIATIQPTYENWFPEPKRNRIGIRSGINLSSASGNGFIENAEPLIGFVGGLSLDHFINNKFYVSIDAVYTEIGFKIPVRITDDIGTQIGFTDLKYKFSYFGFPLRINWQGKWRLKPFASLGLAPQILSKARVLTPSFDSQGNLQSEREEVELKQTPSFDLSGNAQLGASFSWNGFTFQSFLEAQRGLINQTDTDFFDEDKFWHQAISFNVAIKYQL